MERIQVLDSETVNQIAAGEVIERPSAVVKELVENSIDAGANAVTVEIKEGGISLIRITDNGRGIPKDDVEAAFLPHATSKIRTAADLSHVNSLGFRGEALSSIAAVAQVELLTRTEADFTGWRYTIAGGAGEKPEAVGCPPGSTFLVRNLFYNTPARKKFLKTPVTEAGYIYDAVERMAVSHPEVAVKLMVNGQTKLQTPGNGSQKDVIYFLYGREIASNLAAVEETYPERSITGYVGKPVVTRGNRNYENYFINGRYVKNPVVSRAIEDAFKPYLMQHKYPFTSLMLRIEPENIDVNVHPAKLEVRFRNAEAVYQLVYHAVSESLHNQELIPRTKPGKEETSSEKRRMELPAGIPVLPEPFEEKRKGRIKKELKPLFAQESLFPAENAEQNGGPAPNGPVPVSGPVTFRPEEPSGSKDGEERGSGTANHPDESLHEASSYEGSARNRTVSPAASYGKASDSGYERRAFQKPPAEWERRQAEAIIQETARMPAAPETAEVSQDTPYLSEPKRFLSPDAGQGRRIVGQLFGTYWLFEFQDALYLLDQHAAHEKVLFERTMARIRSQETVSQNLMPPIIVTLTPREETALSELSEPLIRAGFEIEPFGGREFALTAVPADLYETAGGALLTAILDDHMAGERTGTPEAVLEKVASMSCKAAVKGNTSLSQQEAQALIDELMTLENPYHCPHGRPTMISMSRQEIEKKFKRIL